MAPKNESAPPTAATLCAIALALPDTREGIACAGTALQARTVETRGKAFLFLGAREMRLKLVDSLAEAQELARQAPDACQASANGWVKLTSGHAKLPRVLLERWIAESHRAVAGQPKTAKAAHRRKPGVRARKTR